MNRIRRFLWFAAGLAAVALVVTLGTESRAIAQAVRAALVQNVDEPGRNPYSENGGCFGTGCNATFSPVPAGKRLVVTFVNGGFGDNNTIFAVLAGHGADVRIFATTPVGAVSVFNVPTAAYYDAGEKPILGCEGCSASFASGTLSGYYVNLP